MKGNKLKKIGCREDMEDWWDKKKNSLGLEWVDEDLLWILILLCLTWLIWREQSSRYFDGVGRPMFRL